MSSKLEQALNLSLDEYISKKGITNVCPKPESTSHFKRQIHSDGEEEEDDLLCGENRNEMDVEELGDTPPPLIRQENSTKPNAGDKSVSKIAINFDYPSESERFVTEEQKRGLKHMPSQQWRLQRENQTVRAGQFAVTTGNFNRNNRFNQRKWNNRNNNIKNQYGKNPRMVGSFNPRFHRIMQRNNVQTSGDLRNIITPSSLNQSHGNMTFQGGITSFRQPQLVTFADMLSRIGQASSNQDRDSFSAVIGNIMRNQQQQQQGIMTPIVNQQNIGQMSSNELMPFAAQTLLNHITAVQQNFGPKYDMKVQKEIHTLQGKSMMYRSLGVVSTDGPGIDNEHIQPKTTDLSMNMRFS